MMEPSELYILLSRLAFGALAVFLSILLWAKTRDTAWMLVILAVILAYGETLYTTLETFGIIGSGLPRLYGIPVVHILLVNASVIMLSLALGVMIRRRKTR